MVDLDIFKTSNKEERYWTAGKLNEFYVKLEDINNRCIGLAGPRFDTQPMKNFMDKNENKGCVLLLTDGKLNTGLSTDRVASGIYSRGYLYNDDYWVLGRREVYPAKCRQADSPNARPKA